MREVISVLRGLFLFQPEKVITQEKILKTPINLGIPTGSPNIFNVLSFALRRCVSTAPLPLARDILLFMLHLLAVNSLTNGIPKIIPKPWV